MLYREREEQVRDRRRDRDMTETGAMPTLQASMLFLVTVTINNVEIYHTTSLISPSHFTSRHSSSTEGREARLPEDRQRVQRGAVRAQVRLLFRYGSVVSMRAAQCA